MSPRRLYLRILQLVSPAPLFPEPFSKTSSFSCPSDSVKLLSESFIAYSFIVTWYCPLRQSPGPFFIALSFLYFPVLPTETIAWPIFFKVFFTLFFYHFFLIFPIHSHFLAMSVSTTITTILPTKFGQVTTGTVVKRYSGGQLNDDFTITKKPMWSPYQIRSDDSRDIKTAFELLKNVKRYTMAPMVTLSTISLLLSSALLFTMMQRLEVWTVSSMPLTVLVKFGCFMTRQHTRLTFEETKKYVDHCIGLGTFTPVIDTKTGNPTADSLTKSHQIFDDQALEDSSHLWHLIVSYISPNLLTGLLERLEEYGNRGPGLLLWMAFIDKVTSSSPQAMDNITCMTGAKTCHQHQMYRYHHLSNQI